MKTFLVISGALLALALVVAVALYLYLQALIERNKAVELDSPIRRVEATTPTSSEANGTTFSVETAPTEAQTDSGQMEADQAPLHLSALPLTDTQKALAKSVGIDVETFVITPEMIACAENTLGADRFDEIKKGATPNTRETISLLACL